MTNPGLPPSLSKAHHERATEAARELKAEIDDLLAEVDDVLAAMTAPPTSTTAA